MGQNRHSCSHNAEAASSATCLTFPTNALCGSSFVQVIKETSSRCCHTYQCVQEPSGCLLLFTPAPFSLPYAWPCGLHAFILMTPPQASTVAKDGAGSVKQGCRESQELMLVQAITVNRDTHGCCVSSRLYPAPPEALEKHTGVARNS